MLMKNLTALNTAMDGATPAVADLGTNGAAWDALALPALAQAVAADTSAALATAADSVQITVTPADDASAPGETTVSPGWLKATADKVLGDIEAVPGYLTHWFEAAFEAGRNEVRNAGLNDTGDVPVISLKTATAVVVKYDTAGNVTVSVDGRIRLSVKAQVLQTIDGLNNTVTLQDLRPSATNASPVTTAEPDPSTPTTPAT